MSPMNLSWTHSFRTPDTEMKWIQFSIIICAFLHDSSQHPLSSWTLLPHILVVEVNGSVGRHPLTCLDSLEHDKIQDIYWRKNGVEEEHRGNSYFVHLEESLGGGNYTCHSKDGSLLNHTEVLIQEPETKKRRILVKAGGEDYLSCSAHNYNGEFRCSWNWHPSRVGEVALIKAWRMSDNDLQCSQDSARGWMCSSGQSNFRCAVEGGRRGITCREEQHCPFAEESKQIHVSVSVRTELLLEHYSKQFYLSEIVKPDKVMISEVNSSVIKWSYPSSWNSPYSYFPLIFQIAQLRRGCKRCENPCTDSKGIETVTVQSADLCQLHVKHKAKAVCVRAKDALCNSHWSEWSHLRLEKNKKNKRRQSKN